MQRDEQEVRDAYDAHIAPRMTAAEVEFIVGYPVRPVGEGLWVPVEQAGEQG
jgi:hypothetical protein